MTPPDPKLSRNRAAARDKDRDATVLTVSQPRTWGLIDALLRLFGRFA